MERYKRVKYVAENIAGSVSKLAVALGVPQTTLNGYLKHKRDDRILPVLDKIIEAYPNIRRDWLYFGSGGMLEGEQKDAAEPEVDTIGLLKCKLAEFERSAAEDGKLIESLRSQLEALERANDRHTREAERVAREAERVSGEAERLWRVIDRLSAERKYESGSQDNQEELMESALDYGNKLQESHKKFKPDAD